jgi:hypothetical protein
MSDRPRFVLVLEPLPDAAPAEGRLKQLLKVALRRFKLRAVEVRETAVEQHQAPPEADHNPTNPVPE